MQRFLKNLIIFLSILALSSCVSYKPIFDENQKFLKVGKEIAYKDFEICHNKANKYLDEYKSKRIVNEISRKAIFGTILGGISGLIFGNSTRSLIKGAVVGGAVGGAYGGLSSASKGTLTNDELKQKFITKCLNQYGYEIIGWY